MVYSVRIFLFCFGLFFVYLYIDKVCVPRKEQELYHRKRELLEMETPVFHLKSTFLFKVRYYIVIVNKQQKRLNVGFDFVCVNYKIASYTKHGTCSFYNCILCKSRLTNTLSFPVKLLYSEAYCEGNRERHRAYILQMHVKGFCGRTGVKNYASLQN